jgi:hypothetical protein
MNILVKARTANVNAGKTHESFAGPSAYPPVSALGTVPSPHGAAISPVYFIDSANIGALDPH